jgi:hypothetical protein
MMAMSPHSPDDQEMIIAAVQMVSVADVATNLHAAERLITRAAEQGASLVALPENFAVLDGGPVREFGESWGDDRGPLEAVFWFPQHAGDRVRRRAGWRHHRLQLLLRCRRCIVHCKASR